MDIVELCKKYRHEGVVAIDLAGDESLCSESNPDHRRAYEVSRRCQRTFKTHYFDVMYVLEEQVL